MMKAEILHGDCLEVMKAMPDSSVDALVLDPPYGLNFMNRTWDHGVPGPAYWAEALRVAKPGAFMLAFGGTRMFHRLMVAIEDGGWELRDTISGENVVLRWYYGSGFPKNLDMSKAVDAEMFNRWLAANPEQAARRKKLLKWAGTKERPQKKRWTKIIERGFNRLAGTEREVVGYDASRARPNRQYQAGAIGNVGGGESASDRSDNGATLTAAATPEAAEAEGIGTALKPSWEPIVVARKPFKGTVGQCFLEHGTGGLNIEACRIDGEPRSTGHKGGQADSGGHGRFGHHSRPNQQRDYDLNKPGGRWPANTVLCHMPECEKVGTKRVKPGNGSGKVGRTTSASGGAAPNVGSSERAEFERSSGDYVDADGTETVEDWDCISDCPVRGLDEQSGESGAGGPASGPTLTGDNKRNVLGAFAGVEATPFHGDSGGASRFFYTAKASRSEREMGLHGRDTDVDNAKRKNTHTTVKPVAIMRWLVKLVARNGQTVLDPFCGSGTTGIACELEGVNFIGIDLELEYVEIAKKRIAQAAIDAGTATVEDADEVGGIVQLGLLKHE